MRGLPTVDTLDHLFGYHAPQGSQAERYEQISLAAKEFARVVLLNAPECPDRTRAIHLIIDARMAANMTIALNEKGQEAIVPVHKFNR